MDISFELDYNEAGRQARMTEMSVKSECPKCASPDDYVIDWETPEEDEDGPQYIGDWEN